MKDINIRNLYYLFELIKLGKKTEQLEIAKAVIRDCEETILVLLEKLEIEIPQKLSDDE